MSVLRSVADVSGIKAFDVHDILPYRQVEPLFHEGDPIIVTEYIRSNQIVIARDCDARIVVTSGALAKRGIVIGEFNEDNTNWFVKWWLQRRPEMNYFWQAAHNSKLIQMLRSWPPIRAEVQVFGHIIPSFVPDFPYAASAEPPTVLVDRLTIDHKEQSYNSFLGKWTPLYRLDRFDPEALHMVAKGKEQISGKQLHPRGGIVFRHHRPQYTKDGQLIMGSIRS